MQFEIRTIDNPILRSKVKMENAEYNNYIAYIKKLGVTLDEYTQFPDIRSKINDHKYIMPVQRRLYDKLKDDKVIYPYQNKDMSKLGKVRYANIPTMEKYLKNEDEFLKLTKNKTVPCQLELTSGVDIFKMEREKDRFQYLYQLDPEVAEHLQNIELVINQIEKDKKSDIGYIFVPYIKGKKPSNNFMMDQHNIYDKIQIVNNEEFTKYLKEQLNLSSQERGKFIFGLNKIFHSYNDMLQTMSELYGENITSDNLMDKVVDFQKKRIYGLKENDIKRRLNEFNNLMKKYKIIKDECHTDSKINLYSKYFEYLGNLNKIEQNQGKIEEIEKCNAKYLAFDEIIRNDLTSKQTTDEIINICKNMKFSPNDTYNGYSYGNNCKEYLKQIKNPIVRNVLNQIGTKEIDTDNRCVMKSNMTSVDFDLNLEYCPEYHEAISQGNVTNAFDHRQLLLGDRDITNFMGLCTLLFRSDPFIENTCDLPGLIHDIEINKVVVSCIANSDDIFPIRIINAHTIENSRIYEPFVKTNFELVGSILVKLKGKRTNYQCRYYAIYVYYNFINNTFRLVDFRGNVILPGSIMEHVRIIYLELNTLMYLKDDIGKKLYYYKLDKSLDKSTDKFDVYVSSYTLSEIIDRYKSFQSITDQDIVLKNLQEVMLMKDENKKFKFIKSAGLDKITGGSAESDVAFQFVCSDYKWNITIDKTSQPFDKIIYPINSRIMQINTIKYFYDISNDFIQNDACAPIGYLRKTIPITMSTTYYKNEKSGKPLEQFNINANEKIVTYQFESVIALYIYSILNKYLKPKNDSNILICSKNNLLLDGLLYYNKYRNFSRANTFFYLYTYRTPYYEKTPDILAKNNIDFQIVDAQPNGDWIKQQKKSSRDVETLYDIAMIDVLISIKELIKIRHSYMFQTYLPFIVVSLMNLKKGGHMVLNSTLITNKSVFDFISCITCHFKNSFVYEFPDAALRDRSELLCSFIVFMDYKGDISDEDINKMIELVNTMFDLDPTGGYLYHVDDKDIIDKFNMVNNPATRPKGYVTKIVDTEIPNNNYHKYKIYSKTKMLDSIDHYTTGHMFYLNRDNRDFINRVCEFGKYRAIYYAKKYDLLLVDWVNMLPEEYFNHIINKRFIELDYTMQISLCSNNVNTENITIGTYDNVKINNMDVLRRNHELSEFAYSYVDKANYRKYKSIEMFINQQYKLLNKYLRTDYGIDINGQYVSRAWIKFYELLFDLKILEQYRNQSKISIFHICEAPGNFVKATEFYMNKFLPDIKYDWHAQSLAAQMADFYDSYGFIKQTKEKWDKGPINNGDITNFNNQIYYYEQYRESDLLIADCGKKWEPSENKNLSITQLFYALIIPRIGGSFVIKTVSTEHSKLYVSLLYLACCKYENIYAFKSNTNFWSPEIYIIGTNKLNLTLDERNTLIKISRELSNGNIIYPVDHVPDDFIAKYEKTMNQFVVQMTDIKKFFVFLSLNDDVLKKNKENIIKIIKEKNSGWLHKYIKN